MVYFIISAFDAFFIIYIPLYYFEILNVNRTVLAFVQLLSYFALFILPLFGIIYDLAIKKVSQTNGLLFISFIPLCGGFLIFLFFKENLLLYGIFIVLSFISKSLIRTGMTGIFLDYVEGEINEKNPKRKIQIIVSSNCASAGSFLYVSLFFNIYVVDISSLSAWNLFFFTVWIFSIPLIVFVLFFFKSTHIQKEKVERREERQIIPAKREIVITVLLFLSIFLSFSDALFSYPKSSWIRETYSESAFRLYSSLYFLFQICSLVGYIIFFYLGKKHDDRKILLVFTILFSPLMLLSVIFGFFTFIIFTCLMFFIGNVINLTYISYSTDFSIKTKYKTFMYFLLQSPSSLASIIFIPLGTYFSLYIHYETLVMISTLLYILSIMFIILSLLVKKIENRKVIGFPVDSVEMSQVT
ncbi:MAG: hypothetical protein ACFFDB_10265 [Promethearchaeota archaeon]